jgi:hypothetical protein
VNIVFFILLNPFLRFLQLPVGEMDPLGLLLTLPLTTYILMAGKLRKKFFYIYILIFTVLIYSLREIIISNRFELFRFLFSLALIILPISCFIFADSYKNLFSKKVFNLNLYLWTVVAIVQTIFPSFKIPILQQLLSRGVLSVENLQSGRGVQAMAVEPAAATYFIVFSFFYSIHLFKSSKLSKNRLYTNFFCLAILSLLTRSGTLFINIMLALSVFYFFSYIRNLKLSKARLRRFFMSLVFSLILFSILIIYVFPSLPSGRFNDVISFYTNYNFSNSYNFIIDFTNQLDGGRLASTVASYNILRIHPFGLGISGYEEAFRDSWFDLYGNSLYLKDGGARGANYVTHLISAIGILGLILIIWAHYFFIKNNLKIQNSFPSYKVVSYSMGIFWLYLSSIPTLPMPWLLLALL